ncbi:hypothetical protein FisN_9Lu101 [Fistulifera solaris]|uniref:HSF-type DNA-binding domain-containing protein n=1 Tax=Fistulifera solaris TaxID=1519565 RepID=A0A1Z5KLB8_FISSO|nr:hypothetical protein FisN_9Lu101 [Fistulifera solaris]|eukprot:GAX26821.1 hypothetical protein FisN_9Lu101 [Fistulifera solaris]
MLLMIYVERISSQAGRKTEQEAIHWLKDGTIIAVRDPDELYSTWLVKFFGSLKYDSFIRKVYRWGFRKSPPTAYGLPASFHVFSHPCFCRDQMDQLCEMKSTTAVKRRFAAKAAKAADPLKRSETIELKASQPADAKAQSNPIPLTADIQQQFYVAPPNYASILVHRLRSLQNEALLTESILLQLQNSVTSAQDLLRFQIRIHQPLQPAELVQLIRRQNAIISPQSPSTALEELLRQLRQNPPR